MSRPRSKNENALVESNKGSMIRKGLACGHSPRPRRASRRLSRRNPGPKSELPPAPGRRDGRHREAAQSLAQLPRCFGPLLRSHALRADNRGVQLNVEISCHVARRRLVSKMSRPTESRIARRMSTVGTSRRLRASSSGPDRALRLALSIRGCRTGSSALAPSH